MLKKLIAFDLKKTRPVMLALIAITVLVEIIGEILHCLIQKMYYAKATVSPDGRLSIDTAGLPLLYFKLNDWVTLFILILPALATLAAIYMIRYYYKTLYSAQGYLSFTLPASITKVVSSKMIVVFIWAVVYIISALPVILIGEEIIQKQCYPLYEPNTLDAYISALLVILSDDFMLVLLLEALSQIMALFFCMSLGQLSSKHKLRNTVLSYMGIGMVSLIFFFNIFTKDEAVWLPANIIYSLILIVIFYFATIKVMNKKLNLE
ncbi:hypothetical protein [Butyrivibrio sp. M55]|uniref:hypothetical protein n=1 Tax=Butyrivibrio sp. M55 TaxID=1855323 RepID=UPI0008F25520|nr:hypothetical protein [Butyrivibrio sp. M55]SFU94077.1 hypothetical protein SAMN05216540_12419 [Butyrivibrio sp. M55]